MPLSRNNPFRNANNCVTVLEVRDALYERLSAVQDMTNDHLSQMQKTGGHEEALCKWCNELKGMRGGLRDAISTLGGNPRRWW